MPAKKMKVKAKRKPRKTVLPFSGPTCQPGQKSPKKTKKK